MRRARSRAQPWPFVVGPRVATARVLLGGPCTFKVVTTLPGAVRCKPRTGRLGRLERACLYFQVKLVDGRIPEGLRIGIITTNNWVGRLQCLEDVDDVDFSSHRSGDLGLQVA